MVITLHQLHSFLGHAALTVGEFIMIVITLSIVSSFLLVVVVIGAASTGAFALTSRWGERRKKYDRARLR